MKLNLREKQSFYHELQQFVHSGITLPQAVEALIPDAPGGAIRQALTRLEEFFRQGLSVPKAFAALRPTVGDLEVELISASSNSGKLDQAFTYLSEYFGTLEEVRAGIIRQLAWPAIQLHIGVLLAEVIRLVTSKGGFDPAVYFVHVAITLGVIYAAVILLWLATAAVLRVARRDSALDRTLRFLPLVGKLRRNLALSRFCATYEMQLQAGINVVESLKAAAVASQSAMIASDINRALPNLLGGRGNVGQLLADADSLPASFRRVLRIGEDTGSLDKDLRHWADYYQQAALRNLQTLGRWLPKLFYAAVGCYLIYCILVAWGGVMSQYNTILDQ